MDSYNFAKTASLSRSKSYLLLVKLRRKFALKLSCVVLAAYYVFMMVVAFAPSVLRTPIAKGSVITIGFPVALLLFFLFWGLTGLYMVRANGTFDRLSAEAIKDANNEKK